MKRTRYLWIEYGVLEKEGITSSDILVYLGLARFVDNETQSCFPSISALCDICRLSRPTVIASIKNLEELKLIKVKRTPNSVNVYHLLRAGGGNTLIVQDPVDNSQKSVDKSGGKKSLLVKNRHCGGKNQTLRVVKNRHCNNTYINNTYLTKEGWFKKLKKCIVDNSKRIKYPERYLLSLISTYGEKEVKKLYTKDVPFKDWSSHLKKP